MTKHAMTRSEMVVGTMFPYPTVVTVCTPSTWRLCTSPSGGPRFRQILALKVVLTAVQARHPVRDERQRQQQFAHGEEQVVL